MCYWSIGACIISAFVGILILIYKMVLADVIMNRPKSDYSDPVYHELAVLNGEINKLEEEQLCLALRTFGLDERGSFIVRQKRLKGYVREKKQEIAGIKPELRNRFDYLLFIDFEATCEETPPIGFQHEIIEFPIVLYDCGEMQMVDEFHEYVKPKLNPVLSPFCSKLTGISQEVVDRADTFVNVFERAQNWMDSRGLFDAGVSFAVATDGPWDISRFLVQQCMIDRICVPHWAARWINVRKVFTNFYKMKVYPKLPNLEGMLEALGLEFEGRPHSGIDDARNIARVLSTLHKDRCYPEFNEFLDRYGYSWMLEPVDENRDPVRIKCTKWKTPQKNKHNAQCDSIQFSPSQSKTPYKQFKNQADASVVVKRSAMSSIIKSSSTAINTNVSKSPVKCAGQMKAFQGNSTINSVLAVIDSDFPEQREYDEPEATEREMKPSKVFECYDSQINSRKSVRKMSGQNSKKKHFDGGAATRSSPSPVQRVAESECAEDQWKTVSSRKSLRKS